MLEKKQVNDVALWAALVASVTGSGAYYTNLVTHQDLELHTVEMKAYTDQVSATSEVIAGASVEIMLSLVEDAIIELEAIPQGARSISQSEKLHRLKRKREKLIRLLEKESHLTTRFN